ncbi:MAG TPA: LytTR family DNA-binding domain-containing protein [Chitinophagaceae bacterium]|nr:LytTR family DNA-binding domain-containing protein [Chitinophagaceae bacterium]
MLNCIAVDDEKLVLDLLVDNIKKVPFLHLVKSCKNAMEAADILQKEKIDLIFLDIQMPGLNGLQFIESLHNPPMIIFVTAYKQYAVEGFNVNAVDYLLKPVSFERFLKACNKAQELYNLQQKPTEKENPPDYFFVYVEYNLVKVVISEILYIEGMKDYIKIFLTSSSRPVITKMSMKAMEEKLSGHRFVRSHKSYIVSADKVTAIKRDLICIDKIELPLSESYKPNVEKMLSL